MKTIQSLLFVALFFSLSSFTAIPANKMNSYETSCSSVVGGAYVVFAGKYHGDIRKSEIATQKEIGVEGCAKGSRIFKFSINVTKSGTSTTLHANSNVLSKEMIDKLKSLSTGDTFEFTSLKAYSVDGKDVIDVHGGKFTVV